MKKVYSFMRRHFNWVGIASFLVVGCGLIAFMLDYNKETSWFSFPAVGSMLFILSLLASLAYIVYFAWNTKKIHITRIRKQSTSFLMLATWLAAAMMLILFIYETITLATLIKVGALASFGFIRTMRYLLTIVTFAYFLIAALPQKIRRKKIEAPKLVKYFTSIGTILWAIFGLLSVYFYDKMTTNNILKIWQIIVYLVFIFFFLMEAKFEHIKPDGFFYIGACLGTYIITMAFCVTTIIALAAGFVSDNMAFTEIELVMSFTIGFYAYARVHAIQRTIKHVMDNSDKNTFSSKFKKKPNDFADSEN